MKSLISLELRKQRKSFLGLMLIMGFCLTFVNALLSNVAPYNIDQTFLLVVVVLQAAGLPFFALILGSSAGAALRHSGRKCEEDIPEPPGKRVFSAYITSLIYLGVLATILFAFSFPIKFSAELQKDINVPFVMVLLLPLHSAAFVFSYWLSQALLGSTVSAMIIGIPAYFFFPFLLFGRIDIIVLAYNAIPGIIALSIHLSFLLWLANRIERERRRWLPIKMTIAVVMMGAFLLGMWGFFDVIPDLFDISRHNEFRQEETMCRCRCS